jgi:uncharacterized protein (DUF305 family)
LTEPDPSAVQTARNGDVFNDADVEFATSMIPHHSQAGQMVVMTQGRPLDPEVEQLAEDIRTAQVPEVETMSDWLVAWDQEVPETSLDHANAGHDMSDMGGDEMGALENASDKEFQEMFLTMMIEHHEGAIEMAETEQSEGENADAVALAEKIEADQSAEIQTIKDLLGS